MTLQQGEQGVDKVHFIFEGEESTACRQPQGWSNSEKNCDDEIVWEGGVYCNPVAPVPIHAAVSTARSSEDSPSMAGALHVGSILTCLCQLQVPSHKRAKQADDLLQREPLKQSSLEGEQQQEVPRDISNMDSENNATEADYNIFGAWDEEGELLVL